MKADIEASKKHKDKKGDSQYSHFSRVLLSGVMLFMGTWIIMMMYIPGMTYVVLLDLVHRRVKWIDSTNTSNMECICT